MVFYVFFFVGDDKIGLKEVDTIDVNVLGSTNTSFRNEPFMRVDTEFGNPDGLIVKVERCKQRSNRWDKRDNTVRR